MVIRPLEVYELLFLPIYSINSTRAKLILLLNCCYNYLTILMWNTCGLTKGERKSRRSGLQQLLQFNQKANSFFVNSIDHISLVENFLFTFVPNNNYELIIGTRNNFKRPKLHVDLNRRVKESSWIIFGLVECLWNGNRALGLRICIAIGIGG